MVEIQEHDKVSKVQATIQIPYTFCQIQGNPPHSSVCAKKHVFIHSPGSVNGKQILVHTILTQTNVYNLSQNWIAPCIFNI